MRECGMTMNVETIESQLPNGFHDSHLLRLNLDYEKRRAVLKWTPNFGPGGKVIRRWTDVPMRNA